MLAEKIKIKRIVITSFVITLAILTGLASLVDARSSSGGRSFGGSSSGSSGGGFSSGSSRSFGGPPPAPPSSSPFGRSSSPFPSSSGGSGSFLKGVAGGMVGGMIGNMLFGRSGYGGGYGGRGGGIGLFDLLILGGIGYFIYKKFIKPNMDSRNMSSPFNPFSAGSPPSSDFQSPPIPITARTDRYSPIRQSEPDFDPEKFKEAAQDIFFKVQAAWMRRDISSVQNIIGQQLKTEYEAQFADLKQKGLINRLENIAVRSIEIADVGQEGQEVYIKILFTANLLDYTVEESSGKVVKGDPAQPVKFEEYWIFARQLTSVLWKLEGIEEI